MNSKAAHGFTRSRMNRRHAPVGRQICRVWKRHGCRRALCLTLYERTAAQNRRSWSAPGKVTPAALGLRDDPECKHHCEPGASVSGRRKRRYLCRGRCDGATTAGTIPFACSGLAASVHYVVTFDPSDEYAVSPARRRLADHPLRLHGSIRPAKRFPADANLRGRLNFACVVKQAAHNILPAQEPTPSEP